MANKKKSKALATVAPVDALAHLGDVADFENDGLSEVDREDIRLAAKVFNFKGVDVDGRKIPEDAYYDTVDETVAERIDAVLLTLHKTNAYTEFDNAENRTQIVCRSFDRKTGTLQETGQERACEGCPDSQWRRNDDGKNTRNCGPVYNVVGLDRANQLPFVVRFKKTSLPVVKAHLQKHHIGRRVVKGKRANYPLFSFQVTLSCRMSDDGKYALPVIDKGDVLPAEEMLLAAEAAKTLHEQMFKLLDQAEAQVASAEQGNGGDASFEPNDFVGDAQGDVVETSAA